MRTCSLLAVLLLLAVGPSDRARAGRQMAELAPRFLTERLVVWHDRTQVVPFEVARAGAEDARFEATSSDPAVLEVVRAPELLAGETTGALRVRGVRAGEALLYLGNDTLRVRVEPLPGEARARALGARITTPANGSYAWGTLALAVEVRPGAAEPELAHVRLRLDGGGVLEAREESPRHGGAVRRFVFALDADALPGGPLRLVPEVETRAGARAAGEPCTLMIVHPDPDDVLAHECEATLELARPEAFGAEPPRAGASPEASGGGFVVNPYADPTWVLPLELEHGGRFQLMLTARGDHGAGAYPSVGLALDAPNTILTAGRVIDHRFRRFPLGTPVALEAGEHALGLRYQNDRTLATTSDRNLHLDRLELLRVDGHGGGAGGGDSMMMDAARMDAMAAARADGEPAAVGGELWIALDRALDGEPINGELEVKAYTSWTGMEGESAARVELLLNGGAVAVQHALRPRFVLDPGALTVGPNTLQLVATLPDGRRAETPVQNVFLDGDPGPHPARAQHRFGALDPRWDASTRAHASGEGEERGHRVITLREPARLRLALPNALEGEFELTLDARGPDGDQHAARAAVSLERRGEGSTVGEAEVRHWWSPRDVGRVALEPGAKSLVLEVDGVTRDGPLRLRALELRAVRVGSDRTPPRARVMYPRDGHAAHAVDAIVAESFDDVRLQSADVLIDGRPQSTSTRVPAGAGRLVLPLVLRGVAPGEHTLAVRVRDQLGNIGESEAVAFRVLEEAPEQLGEHATAVRLLDRFAFGPDDRELGALLTMGARAWLEERLYVRGAGDEAALAYPRALRAEQFYHDLERSLFAHALRTTNPVRTRLVLWIENHFSIWAQKVNQPTAWRTHVDWLELGPAPFGELLAHAATSASMLAYLDQAESYAARLNENYARELLELHTVGVDGGYTQAEVTSLAGLLAGLTIADEAPLDGRGGFLMREFRYDPSLGDGGPRRILGLALPACDEDERFDRVALAIEHFAAHPSTARYVARELARHYLSDDPPAAVVDELARVFLASGGDLRAMLLALAEHPAFLDPALEPRVATPLDFALRLGRATGLYVTDWALADFLRRSGMAAFDRATPDGWPEDDAHWADTNAMLQRWQLVDAFPWAVRQLVPDELRQPPAGDVEDWLQRQVDVAAIRLFGRALDESSNRAALDALAALETGPWQLGDRAAALVVRMPEASER